MSNIFTQYTKPLTPKETAMGKYKQNVDVGIFKAGNVWYRNGDDWECTNFGTAPSWMDLLINRFKDDPDWFIPLDEPASPAGRWRAEPNGWFWEVDSDCTVDSLPDTRSNQDAEYYECGNYFRTEQQAEAAAEAIRAVLGWIQAPNPTTGIRDGFTMRTVQDAMNKARKLIQDKETN
jgi:hypothetical protein